MLKKTNGRLVVKKPAFRFSTGFRFGLGFSLAAGLVWFAFNLLGACFMTFMYMLSNSGV